VTRAGLAIAATLAVAGGVPAVAVAQTPEAPRFVVGMPGCADDVPLQATRETVTFDSAGREIRAHLYSPRVAPNGRAIVLLHGGTGWEMNAILFDAHALQLASRGYRVILPAYFDAARPDSRRPAVTSRAWVRAALDAAAAVASEPGVNPDRVALWGYSRGGGVAVRAGFGEGVRIAAVIGVATGGEVEDVGRRDVPVLLLHARRDEAVPVSRTRDLARSLTDAGQQVEIGLLDFDGHRFDLPTWCDAFARTRAFLEAGAVPVVP
jgi:dienelactone hydrolase